MGGALSETLFGSHGLSFPRPVLKLVLVALVFVVIVSVLWVSMVDAGSGRGRGGLSKEARLHDLNTFRFEF